MLKKILIGLAVLLVVFLVVVATRPSEFRVQRSATMNASAPTVFAQVNELKKWEAWSPWAKMDPSMKQSYEGPAAGNGAVYKWDGNNQVGAGKITISESQPSEMVRFKLDFLRPFESTCTTIFTFKPEGNQTAVTWTMEGKNNFIGKAMSLFMDCDKMVGGQFEQGLAQMKSIVETTASK